MRSHRQVFTAALLAAFALLGMLAISGRAGPGREIARSDCNFLQKPQDFLEAQQARQALLEQMTYRVASSLPRADAGAGPVAPHNLVDVYTLAKMQRDGVAPARLTSDTEFLRRAYLDLTGRIPSSDAVRAFLADNAPDKRDKLVDALVGSPEYVDRWTMFYGDLLKNTIANSGGNRYYEGRNAFYSYIKQNIAQNTPYHKFMGQMISSTGSSFTDGQANYLVGFRATMGPAQDTYDLMWVNVSQAFLGIQTQDCLLCHNGRGHLDQLDLAGSRGIRSETWKLSAFFSRISMVLASGYPAGTDPPFQITERASGGYQLNTTSGNRVVRQPVDGVSTVMPQYIFNGQRPSANFRDAMAQFLTSDPQFARAAVNYIWAEVMGMGIVDPPGTFDLARLDPRNPPPAPWSLQPSNPELLEALAQEFVNSGYDVQHIVKLIAKSTTYQLSSRYDGAWQDAYAPYFARHLTRRLSAEQVHDAVVKATNVPAAYKVQGWNDPVAWAMQLPDTSNPGVAFLNTFGRGNRDTVPRSNDGTILQGLTMMNDSFVTSRVRAAAASSATPNLTRRLLASGMTNQQMVEEMFLTVLNRYPTSAEATAALNSFNGRDRTQATEDLVWALLNKVDFLYNY